MKGLLFSLTVLALLVGSNGCASVSGQKNRNGIVENYSGFTWYPYLGSNDQPVVVVDPYYRSPYYRRSYYSSYYRSSHTGYGGWGWNGCKIVRGSHYQEPRPLTRVIGKIDINVHHK